MIEVKIKKGYPFLVLEKDIEASDIGYVTERRNAIDYILDGDPWESDEGMFTMKLRLLQAEEFSQLVHGTVLTHKASMNEAHMIQLGKIIRVFKTSAFSEGMKEEKEKELYKKAVEELNTAINDFNIISIVQGSQNG